MTAIATRPDATMLITSIQDGYSDHIKPYIRFIDGGSPTDLQSVEDYFRAIPTYDWSAGTQRLRRQAVKNRLRYLSRGSTPETRIMLEQVFKDLDHDCPPAKINDSGITKDKSLSTLEYHKLMDGARSERQRLFMEFLWRTGCRVAELAGVKLSDIDNQGAKCKLRVMGKGSKERFIWLPTELVLRILAKFGGDTWLFETSNGTIYNRTYISTQIAKLGRAILDRRISAHTFRHGFGTRKCVTYPHLIPAISKYMGHSSVKITMDFYVHVDLTDEQMYGLDEDV